MPPPNIIYVLADDLGYGDLGCFNPESKIATPHLNRMASEGMRFTDAHSSSAVCTPTRYGLLTGRYNWRTSKKNGVLKGYSQALVTVGCLSQRPVGMVGGSQIKACNTVSSPDTLVTHCMGLYLNKPRLFHGLQFCPTQKGIVGAFLFPCLLVSLIRVALEGSLPLGTAIACTRTRRNHEYNCPNPVLFKQGKHMGPEIGKPVMLLARRCHPKLSPRPRRSTRNMLFRLGWHGVFNHEQKHSGSRLPQHSSVRKNETVPV